MTPFVPPAFAAEGFDTGHGSSAYGSGSAALEDDPLTSPRRAAELSDEPSGLEIAYGFVKPDAVAAGHAPAIKDLLESRGFDIVHQRKGVRFSKRVADAHYAEHVHQPWHPRIRDFIMSGPTDQLLLVRTDAIKALVDLTGATDPCHAGEHTIRGIFGDKSGRPEKKGHNAFHRADSRTSAYREITLHFTDPEIRDAWSASSYSRQGIDPIEILEGYLPADRRSRLEMRLLLVKPDAYARRADIEERLRCTGLRVAAKKELVVTRELAREHYAGLTRGVRELAVEALTGPVAAYLLLSESAEARLAESVGADHPADAAKGSIRADFGDHKYRRRNAAHYSVPEATAREVSLYFADDRLPWQVRDRLRA